MSIPPDEIEILRRELARCAEDAVPGKHCPDPERLWDAARGESSPQPLCELIDHAAGCAACAQAWRLARELAKQSGAKRARRVPGWLVPAAVAAVLVIGVGGTLYQQPAPEAPPAPVFRGEKQEGIISRVTEPLSSESCVLRWEGPEGAVYSLQVTTEDLEPILIVHDLATPEQRISVAQLASIPAGGTLLWRVETVTSDGRRLISPTFSSKLGL